MFVVCKFYILFPGGHQRETRGGLEVDYCYIGKIDQYMLQIAYSFVLDLIVKAVIAAGAACSSLHI